MSQQIHYSPVNVQKRVIPIERKVRASKIGDNVKKTL